MAGPDTLTFTAGNFEAEVLKSAIPVLVDFWADWCMPCRMLAPAVDKLATAYAGKARVGKFEFDGHQADHQALAEKYGFQALPTFIMFKDGKMVGKLTGPNAKMLAELIETTLQ